MILGKVNAVDDGIPVIWMCSIYSTFFGQDLWVTPINIFGQTYPLCSVIATSIVFAGMGT